VLFVCPYTHSAGIGTARASDALGFGVTCSTALVAGLRRHGLHVDAITALGEGGHTAWVARSLVAFEKAVTSTDYDALLAFHAFWPFCADLRRILDDNGRRCPLVAYTHGSHWDPTDLFRYERYPALRWADLGNLLAADRVLVVSRYMRDTLVDTVRAESEGAGRELAAKIRCVGLPLDLRRIDAAHRDRKDGPATVVFNHAPIAAKQPGLFFDVAAELLQQTSACILVTRHIGPDSPWSGQVENLCRAYPGRLILGGDLPIDNYYAALWTSRIQVSTASHESLGVATLEAMATGNCCLLPRIGAYPEIADGDPAVLYEDPDDLLSRLILLAGSADRQASIAAAHTARVRTLYSPERVAGAVRDVLIEAVNRANGGRQRLDGPAKAAP